MPVRRTRARVSPVRISPRALHFSPVTYRTNKPARFVQGGMIATPVHKAIPTSLKNLNKNLNWNSLKKTRNIEKMSRNNLIKFIMYAYYGAWKAMKENASNAARRQLHNFDYKYMNISTRQRGNHSQIPPRVLWDKLQRLSRNYMLGLAKIIEW
jgi:hypothetical protein